MDVTLVCRSRLLTEAEAEIGTALTGISRRKGSQWCPASPIRRTEGGVSLTVARGGQETATDADQVLIGRVVQHQDLGLAEHGIAVALKGGIVVENRMRTWRAYGAKPAARNALNDDSLRYDNRAMPAFVFTDPQGRASG